jgi:hypothetical protein
MSDHYPDDFIPDTDPIYEDAYEKAIEELGANCNPDILRERAEELIREADLRGEV